MRRCAFLCILVAVLYLVALWCLVPPTLLESARRRVGAEEPGARISVPGWRRRRDVKLADISAQNITGLVPLNDVECLGWRQTGGCDPNGTREEDNDLPCGAKVPADASGYCLFRNRTSGGHLAVARKGCHDVVRCNRATLDAFVNLKIRARQYKQLPLPRDLDPKSDAQRAKDAPTRGIAMAAYNGVAVSAYAVIRVLRSLGCELPVELWAKTDELATEDSLLQELFSQYKVVHRVIEDPKLHKWLVKPYIVYYSRFQHVLLLDADSVPVQDPTYLFDTPEYVEHGAMFFPDLWRPGNSIFNVDGQSLVWELLGLEFVDMFEQESGQALIDRQRSAKALQILLYLCQRYEATFAPMELVYGDKDLFRLSWMMASKSFHFVRHPPGSAGPQSRDGRFCGLTMVQHDPSGKPVFFHRNAVKLDTEGGGERQWSHLQEFRSDDPRRHVVSCNKVANLQCCGAFQPTAEVAVTNLTGSVYEEVETRLLQYRREALGGDDATAFGNIVLPKEDDAE